jgi:UDP-glucose 4-epimerase
VRAGLDDGAQGLVFNVGNDRETTILELARKIIALTGSRSDVSFVSYEARYGKGFEDTVRRVPDVRRARDVLNFSARIDLDEGLQRTLTWWRETYT